MCQGQASIGWVQCQGTASGAQGIARATVGQAKPGSVIEPDRGQCQEVSKVRAGPEQDQDKAKVESGQDTASVGPGQNTSKVVQGMAKCRGGP